jgi:uncharacterized protein
MISPKLLGSIAGSSPVRHRGTMPGSYYVYALLDPRTSPARPFYIGKGHGPRGRQHLLNDDNSEKAQRIAQIRESGQEPLVQEMVTGLDEDAALRIEAQLIASFGRTVEGGPLTNVVLPSGKGSARRAHLVVPHGADAKAESGVGLLKDAVLDFIKANPKGVTNADVASMLGLRSDYEGGSKDYLSFSILGLLLGEQRIVRVGRLYQDSRSAAAEA